MRLCVTPAGLTARTMKASSLASPNRPLTCLLAPRSFLGVDGRVFVQNTVLNIGSFHIAPTQPIAVIAIKIKHKNIQKESTFPLPLIMSLRPPLGGLPLKSIQPLTTRVVACQAIPGVSGWVLGIIKQGYKFKFTRRSPHFGSVVSISVQCSTAHVLRAEVKSFLEKGASPERVRLLQSLLPRPQEGWWSKTHSRSQTSESRPYETAVQNDHIETDPLSSMPRGLVLFAGSAYIQRCLHSNPDSPPPQAVLEIHL